jgi:hypothetical protein
MTPAAVKKRHSAQTAVAHRIKWPPHRSPMPGALLQPSWERGF